MTSASAPSASPSPMPTAAAIEQLARLFDAGASAASSVPRTRPQRIRSDEPPVPTGMLRMYHGGNAEVRGPRWFITDRTYAEGYARKGGRTDGSLLYVDVPEDHPAIADRWRDADTGIRITAAAELPAEIADRAVVLVSRADIRKGI